MTWRTDIVFILLALGLGGLAAHQARMVHSAQQPQTPQQQEVAQRVQAAQAGQPIVQTLPGRPGDVFLRSRYNYVLAAGSRQVPSCFVDPKLLRDEEILPLAERLAGILNLPVTDVHRTILVGANTTFLTVGRDLQPAQKQAIQALWPLDPTNLDAAVGQVTQILGCSRREVQELFDLRRSRRFAWIARKISREQASAIQDLHCRALGIQFEWTRDYPNGAIGGTVVGFDLNDGTPGGGIHLSMQKVLEPSDGQRVTHSDAHRRPIWSSPDSTVRPVDGRNVYLTVDAVIQELLQRAVSEAVDKYDAEWGTGVVINPVTGDVLAMASAPYYDPNDYQHVSFEQMLNRAISVPYEPGSAMKPIFASAAVQEGVLGWQTLIDCENGVYRALRGGTVKDHGARYRELTLWEAIVRSSNIAMAKVGEMLGNDRQYAILDRWGFGQKTGIELPGESVGIVRPLDQWNGYSLRRVPFGQEVSVTALQLAMAFAAIANDGVLMRPRLIEQVTDAQGNVVWQTQPEAIRRVLTSPVAAQTLACMRDVVDGEHGTGEKSRSALWTIWGKTGTAQVAGPQGYTDCDYTGTFVGGAPLENPAVVCLISIHKPDRNKGYYGGTVAGPAVKDVLEGTLRYLNIPSDKGQAPRSTSAASVDSQAGRFAGDLLGYESSPADDATVQADSQRWPGLSRYLVYHDPGRRNQPASGR